MYQIPCQVLRIWCWLRQSSNTLDTWFEELTNWKRLWCCERLKAGGKERHRMRWLNGISDLMDMSLSKLQQIVKGREAWHAAVHGVAKSRAWLSNWTTTYKGVGFVFSSVQLLSRVQLFATLWTAAHQASLTFTISWSLLRLMSVKSVMPSTISFPMSWLFASGEQIIGASASVSDIPIDIQGWFPLGLTGLISL